MFDLAALFTVSKWMCWLAIKVALPLLWDNYKITLGVISVLCMVQRNLWNSYNIDQGHKLVRLVWISFLLNSLHHTVFFVPRFLCFVFPRIKRLYQNTLEYIFNFFYFQERKKTSCSEFPLEHRFSNAKCTVFQCCFFVNLKITLISLDV